MLYWWFGFCIQTLGTLTAIHFGFAYEILGKDPFYITSFIVVLHAISSVLIGYCIFFKNNDFTEMLWFIAEAQFYIGMVGTLIGFMYMFNLAFGHGAAGDIQHIKESMTFISTGMGVAIRATLLGLISGLLLKSQLLLLDKRLDNEK